jgi:hypothetical protein
MSHKKYDDDVSFIERSIGSLIIMTFGIGSLAFLVAIDRPHWFHIRPVSGAAAAMAYAAEPSTHAKVAAANQVSTAR